MRWRQGSHSGLQGAVKTRHQMESSAYDIIVRPPTPLRSDGEISNSPSIDQCHVVVKVFVKFVSTRSCSAAYKASYSVECSVLWEGIPTQLPYAQWPGSWKEYLAFHVYSFYKCNLIFERTRIAAVTGNLIQFHHRRYVSSTTATAILHTRVKMATHLKVAISFTVLSTKAKPDFKFVL